MTTITQDPAERERILALCASGIVTELKQNPDGVDIEELISTVSKSVGQPVEFVMMAIHQVDKVVDDENRIYLTDQCRQISS